MKPQVTFSTPLTVYIFLVQSMVLSTVQGQYSYPLQLQGLSQAVHCLSQSRPRSVLPIVPLAISLLPFQLSPTSQPPFAPNHKQAKENTNSKKHTIVLPECLSSVLPTYSVMGSSLPRLSSQSPVSHCCRKQLPLLLHGPDSFAMLWSPVSMAPRSVPSGLSILGLNISDCSEQLS